MALPAVVTSLLFPLLIQALKWLSPALRKELEEFLQGWFVRCKQSSNKLDDVAAALVTTLLSVDTSKLTYIPSPDSDNLPAEVVDTLVGGMIEVATGTNPFAPSGNELGGA